MNNNALLDISERIKAKNLGRDEVVLFPVKEQRENGPSYIGTIRFGDGRYFATAIFKRENGRAPLLGFRLSTLKHKDRVKSKTEPRAENSPSVRTFLEAVPVRNGRDTPHYRTAFYFENRIYSVRLWVRTLGTKKVLYLKLSSRPVDEEEDIESGPAGISMRE